MKATPIYNEDIDRVIQWVQGERCVNIKMRSERDFLTWDSLTARSQDGKQVNSLHRH